MPPQLAAWIRARFAVEAHAVRDIGLRDSGDEEIFLAARAEGAVVITKDRDFTELVARMGTPPRILWVTCGNTSNNRMRGIFDRGLAEAIRLIEEGESLVELSDTA